MSLKPVIKNKINLGQSLSVLCKLTGLSQTALAEHLQVPASQINRFFRGHSDVYASSFLLILKKLGIDIEDLIFKKIHDRSAHFQKEAVCEPHNAREAVVYLYDQLSVLDQETVLNQLLWTVKNHRADLISQNMEARLQKETRYI